MKTELIRADHPVALQHAVDVLTNGGLVAFPTDTIYGLAVLPASEEVVDRLYVVKGRNSQKAIAVLVGEMTQLDRFTQKLSKLACKLAKKFWPGPLTLVVPGSLLLPINLSMDNTIGVRMPDHPVALALLQRSGPLAVTSANISGMENTRTAQQVIEQLGGKIHLVLDGGSTPGGVPSTVVDCTGSEPLILRQGPISEEQILASL